MNSSRWLKTEAYSCVILGFAVASSAVLWTVFSSAQFYMAASKLPHGTGVRPMGLTFGYAFCAVAGFLLGMPLSIKGGKLCQKSGYTGWMKQANVSVILGCLPLPTGMVLMQLAASAAGVVFEQ